MMKRTISNVEASALREEMRSYGFGGTSTCTMRNLQVRLRTGMRYPGVLALGVPDSPTTEERNIKRNKMRLPPLIFAKRRPLCRHCLKLIEYGERVIRFEADFDDFGYCKHRGFIHASECQA